MWRLYHRDLSYRLDVYYEVDLPELLQLDDQAFLYFAAFFCRDAFVADATGSLFLDRAYGQSTDYAARLGEELRENVYEALRLLTEGFLRLPANKRIHCNLSPPVYFLRGEPAERRVPPSYGQRHIPGRLQLACSSRGDRPPVRCECYP